MNQRILTSIFVIAVCAVISAQAAIASISETGNQREARQYYPGVGPVAPVDAYGQPVMYQQAPPQPQTVIVESQPNNPMGAYSGAGALGALYGALFG